MTIFGSDVSHYDAADTRKMFADGIVFQTHKAGGDANDPELASWWAYARNYRDHVMLGAYWVVRPDRTTMIAAADAFIARLDSQCPTWRDMPFILQVDCERWNNDPATVPTVGQVNAFCDRLVARVPRLRPIAYMPDWVYGDIGALKYPLWSSKYVTGSGGYRSLYPGDSSSKWAGYGGKTPAILQYSSKATIGGQTTCDANAYRGTLAGLTSLLAPGFTAKENDMANADDILAFLQYDRKVLSSIQVALNNIGAAVKADPVDEQKVASLVLAGLGQAQLTDALAGALKALPKEVANQVLADLGQRLQSDN